MLGEITELDGIDRRLLAALQVDAKASLSHLGSLVGLSAPSVMERLRKLEAAGVISGYVALLDARKVGLDITAFIGVSVNYPNRIQAFEEWVAREPQVLECHHVTGGHTLLLKVKCRNTRALEGLISTMRSEMGAEHTETMVVLSTAAERVQVPLPEAAESELSKGRWSRRRARRAG